MNRYWVSHGKPLFVCYKGLYFRGVLESISYRCRKHRKNFLNLRVGRFGKSELISIPISNNLTRFAENCISNYIQLYGNAAYDQERNLRGFVPLDMQDLDSVKLKRWTIDESR